MIIAADQEANCTKCLKQVSLAVVVEIDRVLLTGLCTERAGQSAASGREKERQSLLKKDTVFETESVQRAFRPKSSSVCSGNSIDLRRQPSPRAFRMFCTLLLILASNTNKSLNTYKNEKPESNFA